MLGKRISFPQKTVREKKQEYIKREMDIGRRGKREENVLCCAREDFQLPVSHFVACCRTRKGGEERGGEVFF